MSDMELLGCALAVIGLIGVVSQFEDDEDELS